MSDVTIDRDAALNVMREAEILDTRLDHLRVTWRETVERMSAPQMIDIIDGLHGAALRHRISLEKAMRQSQTEKD